MAYMVQQRVVSAIRESYAGHPDRERHLAAARACRAWLESLEIEPGLRASLVEPIAAVEEALAALVREAPGPG